MTGYDRDLFGFGRDTDGNGCDTRDDVLARDLVGRVVLATDACVTETGQLHDPYGGEQISFSRADSAVDVDHVVALGNAWVTGAYRWDEATREAFANDPLNLLAVDLSLNRQKGDGDAATWLPPQKAFRCAYVARQIAVKKKYDLWLTPPERTALTGILRRCPDQELPRGARAHPTAPVGTAQPQPTATDQPEQPSTSEPFANCDEARAAGAAPVHRGAPGYAPHLDRDNDGVGCDD